MSDKLKIILVIRIVFSGVCYVPDCALDINETLKFVAYIFSGKQVNIPNTCIEWKA